MELAKKEAHSALTRAADDMAHSMTAHEKEAPLYTIGKQSVAPMGKTSPQLIQ